MYGRELARKDTLLKGGRPGCRLVRLAQASVALATLALLVTGVLRLAAARGLLAERLPALASAAPAGASLAAHYAAAAVLVLAAAIHLVRRRACVEPPARRRIAEPRLVRGFLAATLALVMLTGALKLLKGAGVELPAALLGAATRLHDLGVVLVLAGAAAHLLARATASSGLLVPAMLAGVSNAYVRPRQGLWTDELARDARARRRPPAS